MLPWGGQTITPWGARQQLQQDAVSPFPAHPLVTGLLAKVSSAGKASSRGTAQRAPEKCRPTASPTSWAEDQQAVPIQATLPVFVEGQYRDPGQSDGSKIGGKRKPHLSAVAEPAAMCLACRVNMSHPRGTDIKRQSLPASSPVLLVQSDLVRT